MTEALWRLLGWAVCITLRTASQWLSNFYYFLTQTDPWTLQHNKQGRLQVAKLDTLCDESDTPLFTPPPPPRTSRLVFEAAVLSLDEVRLCDIVRCWSLWEAQSVPLFFFCSDLFTRVGIVFQQLSHLKTRKCKSAEFNFVFLPAFQITTTWIVKQGLLSSGNEHSWANKW